MTDGRSRLIQGTYDAFRKVRRKPSRELAGEVVNIVLAALGQPELSGEEWRLLLAHVDCGWAPMPGGATEPQGQATGPPAGANGLPGRCTLWD